MKFNNKAFHVAESLKVNIQRVSRNFGKAAPKVSVVARGIEAPSKQICLTGWKCWRWGKLSRIFSVYCAGYSSIPRSIAVRLSLHTDLAT